MFYIQRRDESRALETVDQFDTRKEARAMCAEYSLADPSARYYVSSRACRDWRTYASPDDVELSKGDAARMRADRRADDSAGGGAQ